AGSDLHLHDRRDGDRDHETGLTSSGSWPGSATADGAAIASRLRAARAASASSSGLTQNSSVQITSSDRIGTATNSPTKPNSWPTITTPSAITAGWRRTVCAITSGIVTLLSICWTIT